ncbi:hypothetical protein BASA83_008909 [Batrachochytrium salamandrivorans]|nr:hypothetical protein BASA62_006233 [Batrachochytrium salamandrivorans]KAH9269033.1 hypothetical protein BASA83_008909 [Batrachochytrium salamandrivorans]
MLRTIKPKTAAGKRAIKRREPVIEEGAKMALFLKGTTTSQIVSDGLKELNALKKPDAVSFSKRNDIHPFDDPKPLEFLSLKNDAALIVLANHSKKRPHNLVIARMFDHQLLDMIELGITNMVEMDEIKNASVSTGYRPLILFNGDAWESTEELKTAKSILLDFFTGDRTTDRVDLRGLRHIVSLTASRSVGDAPAKIYMRLYSPELKKSGVKLPRVEITEMAPHFDFVLRRARIADSDVMRIAHRVPKEAKPKKVKNVDKNAYGERTGRLWIDKQDLSKMQTRKMKGLKRKAVESVDKTDDTNDSTGPTDE